MALQKMVGTNEPEERAREAWRSFKDWQKESTEMAYKIYYGGFPEAEDFAPDDEMCPLCGELITGDHDCEKEE